MFRADLHIHSRFSRATSSRLTIPNLAAWAGAKGIDVLATGDFTHPVWRAELRDNLEYDEESGLYALRKPLSLEDVGREIPQLAGMALRAPRFMLEAEISSIYKKDGRTRKVHSLVYMPDLDAADAFCEKLGAIGNLKSDGRPILGLDVRSLLEMVLEIPGAYMIPAHIWTPWFSLFGSKSGFDSLEECFGDLAPHIFAAETGLSSDPDMNRCWSHLDRLRLTSSSDAHSGENLAREATVFDGAQSYAGIFDALQGREGPTRYMGTLEFFPEEGKYHLDGHRACGVMLEPAECMRLGNICPVCGKPLTVGVLHRVLELSDRTEPPAPGRDFDSLIPLPEIIGELLHCGPKTKKAQERYASRLHTFGPETAILQDVPESDLGSAWPELGEAVRRMRAGMVIRKGGYDGEYGVIRIFEDAENRPSLMEGVPAARRRPLPAESAVPGGTELPARSSRAAGQAPKRPSGAAAWAKDAFSAPQQAAIDAGPGPVLVIAGPGAGKTRTLIGRILRLLGEGVPASEIAAVTFTRRAAEEMRSRLKSALGRDHDLPAIDTMHALALESLSGEKPVILTEEGARRAFEAACPQASGREASRLYDRLEFARETLSVPAGLRPLLTAYSAWKKQRGLADYTDLPESWLAALRGRTSDRGPWSHLLVDEVQDLSPLQKEVLFALLPSDGSGFFGIGDPDQSIYGFRGADAHIEEALRECWPGLSVLGMTESHRSADAILQAGRSTLAGRGACGPLTSAAGLMSTLQWMESPTAEREAAWIADRIAMLIGGTSHLQADRRESAAGCHLESGSCSPGDIAVLCRIKALIPPIRAALEKRGIPCAAPETEAFWADERAALMLQGAACFLRRKTEAGSPVPGLDLSKFPLLAAMAVRNPGKPAPDEPLGSVTPEAWAAGPDAVLAAAAECFDPLFGESAAFRRLRLAWKELEGWEALLRDVALKQEIDAVRQNAEFVQLMTLHASKGLEFKAVFIPGAEDGLLPFRGVDALLGKPGDFEAPARDEEERLLYVGITRASEAVFLSSAVKRTLYGHALSLPTSPLLPLGDFSALRMKKHTKTVAKQIAE
ncbi:MAG: UvrD-helicase domain-containing protein, partial [Mailhella sp.]|nr:UvrD-helicase domain-containing protein [Mailhella sp.]